MGSIPIRFRRNTGAAQDGSSNDATTSTDVAQSIHPGGAGIRGSSANGGLSQPSQPTPGLTEQQRGELQVHMRFLSGKDKSKVANITHGEGPSMTTVFTGEVLTTFPEKFPQYGLLGERFTDPLDPRLLLNVSEPRSIFLCGSQGSGKSHTLSCILENCLRGSEVSNVNRPLSGIVFHWDRFSSSGAQQVCEAAYLCSIDITVRVLVAPSSFTQLKVAYENLPGLGQAVNKPIVVPMLLDEKQLDIPKMKTLMGFTGKEGSLPLYMESIMGILCDMAEEEQHNEQNNASASVRGGFDYNDFRQRVRREDFSSMQKGPLNLRLKLLERFMRSIRDTGKKRVQDMLSQAQLQALEETWEFKPGELTIVDLSSSFVDEGAACALFNICLQLFLGKDKRHRVVALDEAHKFLTGSNEAVAFTGELLYLIREQRHKATRTIISTQEPTLSPKLLELCSTTIVHRFTSPDWFKTLQSHIAAVSNDFSVVAEEDGEDKGASKRRSGAAKLFQEIVNLEVGEGLLFSPDALTEVDRDANGKAIGPRKLGMGYLKMRTRQRLTADGGRSIMAV